MADELGRMHQRFLVDGATVEFQHAGGLFRRGSKPQTGHILSFSQGGVQLLMSGQAEANPGDKVDLAVHLRNHRNWLKAMGQVIWCRDVPSRPFKRAGVRFNDMDADQAKVLRDLEMDYLPIQDGESRGQTGRLVENYKLAPETNGRNVAEAKQAESERFGGGTKVARPLALLALIDKLATFEVNDELVLTLLEALQQGTTIEQLLGAEEEQQEEVRPRRRVVEEKPKEEAAKPMPVYRLDGKTPIHFNDEGVPVTPPVDHLFFTRFQDKTCFACELVDDRMANNGQPAFRPGDILVFSSSGKVESGNFVFLQSKQGADEFTQIFFSREGSEVRMRPLNGNYSERVVRRADVKQMFKIIARIERMG